MTPDEHYVNKNVKLPIIPKFVAKYIEEVKDTYMNHVRFLLEAHNGDPHYINEILVEDGILTNEEADKLFYWAEQEEQENILGLVNGYVVEEEPLYYAKTKLVELNNFLNKDEIYFDTIGGEIVSLLTLKTIEDAKSRTKDEWLELNITEDNAIFEKMSSTD